MRWQSLAGAQHWAALYGCTFAITVFQIGMRMWTASRIYGWKFAALSPVRVLWGNVINFHATSKALWQSRSSTSSRGVTLRWHKTDHSFPVHSVTTAGRPRLGEVLVRMRCVDMRDIDDALRTMPQGSRLLGSIW